MKNFTDMEMRILLRLQSQCTKQGNLCPKQFCVFCELKCDFHENSMRQLFKLASPTDLYNLKSIVYALTK